MSSEDFYSWTRSLESKLQWKMDIWFCYPMIVIPRLLKFNTKISLSSVSMWSSEVRQGPRAETSYHFLDPLRSSLESPYKMLYIFHISSNGQKTRVWWNRSCVCTLNIVYRTWRHLLADVTQWSIVFPTMFVDSVPEIGSSRDLDRWGKNQQLIASLLRMHVRQSWTRDSP